MGFVTIEEGEQALMYNVQGQGQLILGPRRVRYGDLVCTNCARSYLVDHVCLYSHVAASLLFLLSISYPTCRGTSGN